MLIDGTGVVWIIVMFLSAVWTLILTAPIHCRWSFGDQVKFNLGVHFQQIWTFCTCTSLHVHKFCTCTSLLPLFISLFLIIYQWTACRHAWFYIFICFHNFPKEKRENSCEHQSHLIRALKRSSPIFHHLQARHIKSKRRRKEHMERYKTKKNKKEEKNHTNKFCCLQLL